MPTLQL